MNRVAASLRFAFATPADDAGLRRLLRETPMHGAIRVGFTREPDYFRGTGLGGARDRTLVAFAGDRLVAAGRCIERPCWLNGAVRRVAYLGELRLAAEAQGRWDVLRGGYAFFAAEYGRDPADFCFTSILADNLRARRLLERGLPDLPRYRFIGDYATRLLPAARSGPPHGFTVSTGEEIPPAELAAFLNDAAATRQLAAHWTPATLQSLEQHGLKLTDFLVLRKDDTIVACAGLWDQRAFRQVMVAGYTPSLALLRPAYNVLAPWIRQPRLPRAGSALGLAFLSPYACLPGEVAAWRALVGAARDAAARRGLDCLAVGGVPANPEFAAFGGRSHASRLYRVDWPNRIACELDARPCLPDISLL